MRLTDLDATELFSFDDLALDGLPGRALVIVGPNGSGKTNISRLAEIVVAAIDRYTMYTQEPYLRLVEFASGRRIEAAATAVSTVNLGIALTEDWESDLLVRFVRAALFTSLLRDPATVMDRPGVQAWVNAIDADDLAPLARGTIRVELTDAMTGQWSLAYDFDSDGERFRWVIEGAASAGTLIRVDDADRGVPVYFVTQGIELDDNRVPARSFSFADLLPPAGEGRVLLVEAGTLSGEEPVRAWGSMAGIAIDELQRRNYTVAWVLRVLFQRGVAFLGDLRLPPQTAYSVEEAGFDPSPADGSRVPLRLFRLKNGAAADRRVFVTIQELFRRLTGATFDVMLAADSARSADAPVTLRIAPVVGRARHDLAMEFAGAGVWEALLLSATLSDSRGRVVILDEPARNLHPTLQRRLLDELRGAPGQFIVTTHSPYLVPVKDASDTAICRLALSDGATRAHFLPSADDDARLRKALAESADARALLFAHGVVLVEGGTELGALPAWFAKSQTAQKKGTPEALNVAIFSVDGDTGFGTFVRYLAGVGVPWAIVCDGAIFRFGTGKTQIFDQILKAGVNADELRATVLGASQKSTFAEMQDVGRRHGIFTVARTWDSPGEAFEAYVEAAVPGELSAAAKLVGNSKPRQGRQLAAATACPTEIDDLYARILERLGPR